MGGFLFSLTPRPLTQITFFEEKKFQGRCYNCSSDCADLQTYFGRCSSIRVESGVWVIYERAGYKGFQYVLSPGEYADNQRWMAFNDNVKSCRAVKNVRQPKSHGNAAKSGARSSSRVTGRGLSRAAAAGVSAGFLSAPASRLKRCFCS